MKDLLLPRTPYVGSLVKKLMAINPELGAQDLIAIIKESTEAGALSSEGFSRTDVVDEELALRLAKQTLSLSHV